MISQCGQSQIQWAHQLWGQDACMHIQVKTVKSFVYSLAEVGQKLPQVMDAWLKNLCANMGPCVTEWSMSAAVLVINMDSTWGYVPCGERHLPIKSCVFFSWHFLRFTAEEEIDCQLHRFRETLCLLVWLFVSASGQSPADWECTCSIQSHLWASV